MTDIPHFREVMTEAQKRYSPGSQREAFIDGAAFVANAATPAPAPESNYTCSICGATGDRPFPKEAISCFRSECK